MVQDIRRAATTPPCVTHTPVGATIVCHVCHPRLSLQLEAEATHRVITIANRVSGPERRDLSWSHGGPCASVGVQEPSGGWVPWTQHL